MKDGASREDSETAVFSTLASGFEELALEQDREILNRLTRLVLLLDEWSGRINLTGHRGPIEIASRLVLDAVALSSVLPELRSAESLADLGSGAGFPGLPIAILNPHLSAHLVDSRLKRHHFRREARRQLDLEKVISVLGRSDEVPATPCDIVVAQAMANPRSALEWMIQWAKSGALLVLPASETSVAPDLPPGLDALELREYIVPVSRTRRKLWLTRTTIP